jgi:hypothetical protein
LAILQHLTGQAYPPPLRQWPNLHITNSSLSHCLCDSSLELVTIDLVQGSRLKYQQLLTEAPISEYVEKGKTEVAYSVFIDEGGAFRHRGPYPGSERMDWGKKNGRFLSLAVLWARKSSGGL